MARKEKAMMDLLHAEPVRRMAEKYKATPAQVLLRYALERGCSVIPKTTMKDRLLENAMALHIMTQNAQRPPEANLAKDLDNLQDELIELVRTNHPNRRDGNVDDLTRLCWRRDPLRHLDFE